MDYNNQQIIGRVGKEPEGKYLDNGKFVLKFSAATSWKFGEKEGTEWFNVEFWGKMAEPVSKFLSKGNRVFVEGETRTDKFAGKDGQEKTSRKIVARSVIVLENAKQENAKQEKSYEETPW